MLYKTSVEYLVQKIFDGGRVMAKHVRAANIARGRLTVAQEQDTQRHRVVLVARLLGSGSVATPFPPLYDVSLVASNGGSWTLASYERIEAGPLRHVHFVGQSWIIEPGAIQDLIQAEHKWGAASSRAHELEQQLIAQGLAPKASNGS